MFTRFRKKTAWRTDRKEEKRKSPFEKNSYIHLRQNVKPESKLNKLPKVKVAKDFNFQKLKRIFNWKLLFALVILISIGASIFIALRTNIFVIRNIKVQANVESSMNEQIQTTFTGQNIFKINQSEIEEYARSLNPRVQDVLVRRIYPDKLDIEIKIDIPRYLMANFNGGLLLNDKFEVLDRFDAAEPLILLQYEKDLLSDIGNEESLFVADAYRKSLSEEERELFKWEDVGSEKKKEVFGQIKADLFAKVDAHFDKVHKELKAKIPEYDELRLIDFYEEENVQTMQPNISQLEINERISKVIEENEQEISWQRWISRLNLKIKTNKNITLHLSTANVLVDVDTQFESLEAVINEGKFKEGASFDFRSKNFVGE